MISRSALAETVASAVPRAAADCGGARFIALRADHCHLWRGGAYLPIDANGRERQLVIADAKCIHDSRARRLKVHEMRPRYKWIALFAQQLRSDQHLFHGASSYLVYIRDTAPKGVPCAYIVNYRGLRPRAPGGIAMAVFQQCSTLPDGLFHCFGVGPPLLLKWPHWPRCP